MASCDYFAVKLSKFRTEFIANEKLEPILKWIEETGGREPKTFYIYKTTDRKLELVRTAIFDPKLVWKEHVNG